MSAMSAPILQLAFLVTSVSPMFNYSTSSIPLVPGTGLNSNQSFSNGNCQKVQHEAYPAFCYYSGSNFFGDEDVDSYYVIANPPFGVSFGPFNGDRMDILANALGGSCNLSLSVSSNNGSPLFDNNTTLDNGAVSQPLSLPNPCQGCFLHFRAEGCTTNTTFAFGGLAFSSPGNIFSPCESQITAPSNWATKPGQKQKPDSSCPSDGPFIPRTTSSNNASIQVKFNGSAIAVNGNYHDSSETPSRYSIMLNGQSQGSYPKEISPNTIYFIGGGLNPMFFISDLETNVEHTLTVSTLDDDRFNYSISEFQIFKNPPSSQSQSATAPSQPSVTTAGTNLSSTRHLSKAAISGTVVGTIAGVLLLVSSLLFFIKRRRKRDHLEGDSPGGARLVTPFVSAAITSGTQLDQQSQKPFLSSVGGQFGTSDSDLDKKGEPSLIANTFEEMSEPRRSEDGGLTDLVREQLEEEDLHTEDQGTRERLVERVVHLVSARLGAQFEDVPPSYASQD